MGNASKKYKELSWIQSLLIEAITFLWTYLWKYKAFEHQLLFKPKSLANEVFTAGIK